MINDLRQGRTVAVSDGSACPHTYVSTAGWILESKSGKEYISGMAVPFYSPTCSGSFRAEATGLLAITHMASYLCLKYDIDNADILIGSDNVRALHSCFLSQLSTRNPKHNHSDILSGVTCLRKLGLLNVTPKYVKAHQDEHIPYESLDRLSQMNVRMDWLAKVANQQVKNGTIPFTNTSTHPMGFTQISVQGQYVPHQLTTSIYSILSNKTLHQWWLSKGKYRLNDIPSIHWDICRQAAQSEGHTAKMFASKWSTGFLATGHKVRLWNIRAGDSCPFCSHPQEDTSHILQCQHDNALQIWSDAMQLFITKLSKFRTCPTLLTAIVNEVTMWRYGLPQIDINNIDVATQQCIKDIRGITIPTFLEGFIPKSLIIHQNQYFQKHEHHTFRGQTWAKKVYKACWSLLKEVWIGRNDQLHNTERIAEFQGLPILKSAIEAEYRLGLQRLPACEFSIYFSTRLNKLLQRNIEQLKNWLLTIRLGRELHGGINEIHDEFSVNGPLRVWLGLKKL